MFVNKVKIRYDKTTEDTSINIPIRLDFTPIDNSELVEDKFVKKEIAKVINPIADYKKVRFKPAKVVAGVWEVVPEYKLQNTFLKTTPALSIYTPTPSSYGNIGFTDADLFCRVNSLLNSFMTLSFYDSPNASTNRLLFFNTMFVQVLDDQKEITGQVKAADEAPISFVIGDPIFKPDTDHEGFHLYWFKDLVDDSPNKEYVVYMTASFNDAKHGYSIPMFTRKIIQANDAEKLTILGPDSGLFLKVILKYDETDKIYKYTFVKQVQQTGVNWNNSGTPLITFYQVTGNEY